MTRVTFSHSACADLDRLVEQLQLPVDTRRRVKCCAGLLRDYPLAGKELSGQWAPRRVIFGPWRWMMIVYEYDGLADVVNVLAIQDPRLDDAAG